MYTILFRDIKWAVAPYIQTFRACTLAELKSLAGLAFIYQA